MDFKTLNVVLSNVLSPENPDANFPTMIRGRHGIGKSEVIYQLARTLGMKVVERRISQMMEGDLTCTLALLLLLLLMVVSMVRSTKSGRWTLLRPTVGPLTM